MESTADVALNLLLAFLGFLSGGVCWRKAPLLAERDRHRPTPVWRGRRLGFLGPLPEKNYRMLAAVLLMSGFSSLLDAFWF
jgi:hypothetical protein